jgi:flavin-dependent dehydrogenase
MSFDADVAILGGGPAGSLCAALLRKQAPELRITVLERETFPRHHVGEACLPGWATILERAGVLEAAHAQTKVDKLGFIFNWGAKEEGAFWTADFRNEAGDVPRGSWHVDRGQMDTLFLEHAASLGADVHQPARVLRVEPLSGATPPALGGESPGFRVHFERDGQAQSLTAHRVVDATGQARLLARQWDLPLHQHPDMNNYAVYGYWRGGQLEEGGAPLEGRERWAVVSTHELGWMWHIPIGPDLVSVGLVTHADTLARVGRDGLRDAYLQAARETARIDELVEGATYIGDRPAASPGADARVNVVRDWSYRCDQVCGAGWFVVGDGAVFVDPILSSGLTLASTGASMVANAITTLARDPSVDAALLRRSFREAYQDISSAYHRMARVWYRRNTRAAGWHWQARQERLRTAGSDALFEDDADAFTAVCLGVLNSPLNAALPRHSQEVWGSEYFTWITADWLFGRAGTDDQGRSTAGGIHEARTLSRRSLVQRWQRIVDGRVRLMAPWAVARGYHTNRFVEVWEPIRYVALPLQDPLDPHLRVACPAFEDQPEGIFPALDGQTPIRDALVRLLDGRLPGTPERDARLKAVSETLLQLDMLGLLEIEEGPAPPPLGGHPLLSVVANVVLRSLDAPATVFLEVDWLGECVWVRVLRDEDFVWLRLIDGRGGSGQKDTDRTATTRAQWPRRTGHWSDGFAQGVLRRLRRLEAGPRGPAVQETWARMRDVAGQGIAFDHVPGQKPRPRPL